MFRSNKLEEESFHNIGAVNLETEEDIVNVNHVTKHKFKVNAMDHLEILGDFDDAEGDYIGIQKEDFRANHKSDEAEEESWKVNMGGYRRDDEPIPESYWDKQSDIDDEDELTEDDDE